MGRPAFREQEAVGSNPATPTIPSNAPRLALLAGGGELQRRGGVGVTSSSGCPAARKCRLIGGRGGLVVASRSGSQLKLSTTSACPIALAFSK